MEADGKDSDAQAKGETPSERQPDRHGFFGPTSSSIEFSCVEREVPVEVIRRREKKWRHMLDNWDLYTSKKFNKVRDRCRKGIPPSMRMLAWQYLSGGIFRQDKCEGLFAKLCAQKANPECENQINLDISRQFPHHAIFRQKNAYGQTDLYSLCRAYSILRPEVGYCQGQGPIAAFLLMYMPLEAAFFCYVEICDKYLKGYYNDNLETVQLDCKILFGLLRKFSPQSYDLMTKFQVNPIVATMSWFLCVYIRDLPWPCVLRVFDMFLCEGIRVLFKVGIVLIHSVLGSRANRKAADCEHPETETDVASKIIRAGAHLDEHTFVQQVVNLDLRREDLVREHERQIAIKEKEERDKQKKALKTKRS